MTLWAYGSASTTDEKHDYWQRTYDNMATDNHGIYMPQTTSDAKRLADTKGYSYDPSGGNIFTQLTRDHGLSCFFNNSFYKWGTSRQFAWYKLYNSVGHMFSVHTFNCPFDNSFFNGYEGYLIRPFFCKVPVIEKYNSSSAITSTILAQNPYSIVLMFGKYSTHAEQWKGTVTALDVSQRLTSPLHQSVTGEPTTGSVVKSSNFYINHDSNYYLPISDTTDVVALRPYFGADTTFQSISYPDEYYDLSQGVWNGTEYVTDGTEKINYTASILPKYAFGDATKFPPNLIVSPQLNTVAEVIYDRTSFESNIPVFDFYYEHTPTDLENYLKTGQLPKRSDGLDTKYSVKINGLTYPNCRLSIVDTGDSDFYNDMIIHMRLTTRDYLNEHSLDGVTINEERIRYLNESTRAYKTFSPNELIDEFYHFSYTGLINDGAHEFFASSPDDPLRFRHSVQILLYGILNRNDAVYYLNPLVFDICRTGEGNALDMVRNIVEFSMSGNGSSLVVSGYTDDTEPGDDPNEGESDEGGESTDDYPENEPTSDPSPVLTTNGVLTTSYQITHENLQSLGSFLWSDSFLDNLKLLNNNPIENIVSIKALPLALTGTTKPIVLGNVNTGISGKVLTQDAYSINVGRFSVRRHFNNFLDYSPYTKLSIYLPFVGIQQLDVNTLYGKTIFVKYTISVIDGTCRVQLLEGDGQRGYPLYTFNCKVGADLSITASNRAQVEGGYIASGLGVVGSLATGNVLGATISGLSMAQSQFHSTTSGACSPNIDFSIDRKVWLIWDLPNYMRDTYDTDNYKAVNGKPYQITTTLSNLTKFIKCGRIKFGSIPYATDKEKEEIKEYLQNGVYVKRWGDE